MVSAFARILVFDALVGIGDRHRLNWAVLRGPSGSRLAPMFDASGCMGSELDESRAVKLANEPQATIETYVRRCFTGFGDGATRPQISQLELLDHLRAWPEWSKEAPTTIDRFAEVVDTQLPAMLEQIPSHWLSEPRKKLIARLLPARVTLVSEELER